MPTIAEKNELFKELLYTASPQQFSKLIEMLEQHADHHDFNEIILGLKRAAFVDMLTVLKINERVFNRTGKGFKTHLHLGAETGMVLVLSQKDSQDLESTYVKLYDQHKNELLLMIDVQAIPQERELSRA